MGAKKESFYSHYLSSSFCFWDTVSESQLYAQVLARLFSKSTGESCMFRHYPAIYFTTMISHPSVPAFVFGFLNSMSSNHFLCGF